MARLSSQNICGACAIMRHAVIGISPEDQNDLARNQLHSNAR